MRMSTAWGLVPVARSTSSAAPNRTILASSRAVSMLITGGCDRMAAQQEDTNRRATTRLSGGQ